MNFRPTELDLAPTYGVLLVGVLFATFFQGVLTVQVYQYYLDFPDDPPRIKILAAALWILGLIQLVLISHIIYYYLVANWGNVRVLEQMILPYSLHLFFIALSILLSQLFLIHRIWVLSNRSVWIVGPVFVCSLGTFVSVVLGGLFFQLGIHLPGGMLSMLIVGTVTDIMIAALLCYYVLKRSEGTRDMRVTNTLVTQIIRYTIATSGLTSIIMLSCILTYIAFPSPFICIALHFSSGRTYANAVLVNLNGRSKLRETLDKMEPSFAKTTELGGSSSIIRRLPRLGASTYEHSSHFTTISSRSAAREIKPVVQVPSDTYPPRPFRHSLP